MKQYSQATPITTTLDGTRDYDHLTSLYRNLRYTVAPERTIILDARYEFNLPGLAFDYYGSVHYWRAIMWFNAIVDPLKDTRAGTSITLPSKIDIDALMASEVAKPKAVVI